MRLLKQDINLRDGSGSATLLPNEPEDMWHLYNLIRAGDTVRAPAIRKVVTTSAATGSSATGTVRTTLSVRVLRTDFDAAAAQLHVAGRVCAENAQVALGLHHTLDLELNRQFTVTKGGEDGWDSVAVEMLREATDVRKQAEVFAVVMHEGLASICVITEHQTLLRQRVEAHVPRKRAGHGGEAHEKAVIRFFDTTLATLLRHMDLPGMAAEGRSQLPPLLLASPGFLAQAFQKYILEHATRTGDKALGAYARQSIMVAHSSSGYLHGLNEVLKSPAVLAKLSDTKYARETQLMEKFLTLVREDEGRAWYGPKEVEAAVEKGAVGRGGGVLLVSNRLFRSQDIATRKRWVALVEKVKVTEGGEVRILSSAHETGKKLEGLGGIGAILTFPVEDLDDGEEEEADANGIGEVLDIEDDGAPVWEERAENVTEQGQNHDRIHEDIEI